MNNSCGKKCYLQVLYSMPDCTESISWTNIRHNVAIVRLFFPHALTRDAFMVRDVFTPLEICQSQESMHIDQSGVGETLRESSF